MNMKYINRILQKESSTMGFGINKKCMILSNNQTVSKACIHLSYLSRYIRAVNEM